MANRRFGWHSGKVHAKEALIDGALTASSVSATNLQSGTVDITTDGSGDGSASVTFGTAFSSTPVVIATAQEADTTGTLSVTASSTSGFTVAVDGSSVVSDTLTVGWIAKN